MSCVRIFLIPLFLVNYTLISLAAEPDSFEAAAVWPALNSSADEVLVHGSTVFFKLNQSPANKQITFPRLRNRMVAVYVLGDVERKPLKLNSEPNEWSIILGEVADQAPCVIVLELGSPPKLGTLPFVVQPNHNTGVIDLPASVADTTGVKLRYEPQPHKNTVGYWVNADETASWTFDVTHADYYTIEILQGCGTGQGGSEVDVVVSHIAGKIEPQTAPFIVEETGHFQNFKRRNLGTVQLTEPGTYEIKLVPKKLANKAVMDVRHLILTPNTVPDTRL